MENVYLDPRAKPQETQEPYNPGSANASSSFLRINGTPSRYQLVWPEAKQVTLRERMMPCRTEARLKRPSQLNWPSEITASNICLSRFISVDLIIFLYIYITILTALC